MIDPSDEALAAWVRGVLPGVEVSLDRPASDTLTGRGVHLYLLEVNERPAMRSTRVEPQQLALAYLVTTWAADPPEAHRMLLELAFAAMDHPDLELELRPPGSRLWHALGVPPQPSLRVSVPVRRARPEPAHLPVLWPLDLRSSSLGVLAGAVRTSDDRAVPGAVVEVERLDRRTTTDRKGRFHFEAMPAAPTPVRLRVRAKGREVLTDVGNATDRGSLLITVDPWEGSDAGIPDA